MKKTIILSTDDNSNYLPYLEYTQRAWNLLGWDTLTFYLGSNTLESTQKNKIVKIYPMSGYKNCTIVQVSRLFGFKYITDGIIMTSDIDMIPLSDYWKPEYNNITCYGYDLTNFTQFPICYIAANQHNWENLINSDSIEALLSDYPYAKSDNFNQWWFTDQLIITDKIKKFTIKPHIVYRGLSIHNLALGRVDRIAWNETRYDNNPKIDAHMPRPFSEDACNDIINNILIPNI